MSRGDKISMCYTRDLILMDFTKNRAPENSAGLRRSFYYERNSGARYFPLYVLISAM